MRAAALVLVVVATATPALASPAASPSWAGRWIAKPIGLYGARAFTLEQRGSAVTGRFGWSFRAEHGFGSPPCFTGHGGTLTGTVRARRLTATLTYPRREGHARTVATLNATISRDGRSLTGQGTIRSGECRGVFWSFEASRAR